MDCADSAHNLLERMLLDANTEPTSLPLSLLKDITDDFSDDQIIGRGGSAVVYKGVLRNGTVAVKQLSQAVDIDERNFNQEVRNLVGVKHKNIVRLLGYCADTQGKVHKYEGKVVVADERQRLLCFEFMPNGSLDKYLSDASRGLDWRTHYQIIKGICSGLHYLHQQRIVHLDLKPANILLDHYMVPKIADFGISKCFDGKETRAITSKVYGTQGYMAPEFYGGVFTFKSDIYSLGSIIVEMLAGRKGYPQIENGQGGKWLEYVRACAEIGIECIDHNPDKRPPTHDILDKLARLELRYGLLETDVGTSSATHVLEVHPLEVCFPFEPNKLLECPVTLTNRTDHHVGVWITPTYPDVCSSLGFPYMWEQPYYNDKGSTLIRRLEPRSSLVVYITMTKQQKPPLRADTGMFEVVMIGTESEEDLIRLESYLGEGVTRQKDPLDRVKELGTEVHHATLRAVTCGAANKYQEIPHQLIQSREFGDVRSIDVHPTQTWVLVGHDEGYVSIWNYETQERIMLLGVTGLSTNYRWLRSIDSTKFIAGEQWFAAGDRSGSVHVYAYATKDKVKEFEPHNGNSVDLLAVHSTEPLLLTASSASDKSIKLWDWGQGWTCTRVFDAHSDRLWYVTIGPRGTNTFASASENDGVKFWHIHSSDSMATFDGSRPTFCTDNDSQRFLITTDCGNIHCDANYIWDLQTEKHVHTLYHIKGRSIDQVACHPTRPILATITELNGSNEKHVFLWDARTYRLKKRVVLSMDGWIICMTFDGTEGLTRLVVASSKEISIININLSALFTGGGN